MEPFVLAQAATRFSDIREIDWTLNAVIYLGLAAALVAVYFASVRAFERSIDGACAGKPVGVRDAYTRFWSALGLGGFAALALAVFVSVYPVKSLFVAG